MLISLRIKIELVDRRRCLFAGNTGIEQPQTALRHLISLIDVFCQHHQIALFSACQMRDHRVTQNDVQNPGIQNQTQTLAAVRCRQRLRKRVANFIHTDLFQQTIILGNCCKDLLRQVKAQLRRVLNRFHHLDRVLAENLFGRSRGTNEFFLDVLPSVVRIDQLIRIIRDRIDRKRSACHVILDLIAELHRSRPCLICLHTRRALAISRVVVLDALTYAGNLGTIASDIDNERCFFVKGDICDRDLADQLFSEYKFDYIVNFAAESHVDRSIENPQLFLQTNILGTQNLLDAARRAWVTGKDENGYPTWRKDVRYHQVSTDEVYGSLGAEGFFTETTPLCPHSPYSASKTSADMIVMAYRDTYKMPVTITRCSNNYGPYHFPEKLIPLIIKNILEGKKLPVYGDGKNVRDWLYVEDHCKAIDLVLRKGREGEVYNVGGHNEKENIEIVKLTIATIHRMMTETPEYRKILKKKELNDKGEISIDWINESLITFVKDRLGHDQRYAIDPTKITNELGWYPETKFETGIVKTIQWYLENQAWVENVTSGDYQKYYERMYKNR